jgi:hypothetical protein
LTKSITLSCGSLEGNLFKAPRIEAAKNLSMEKSCSMENKLVFMGLLRLGSFKARNSNHIDNGTNKVASDFICCCVLFHIFQMLFKMHSFLYTTLSREVEARETNWGKVLNPIVQQRDEATPRRDHMGS